MRKVHPIWLAGIGVSNVDHRHPKVSEAISRNNLDKYLHWCLWEEYVPRLLRPYGKALTDYAFPIIWLMLFLVNSGSEAIEGAIKLRNDYWEGQIWFSVWMLSWKFCRSLSVGGMKFQHAPIAHFSQVFLIIAYGSFSDLEKINSDTAAMIVETISGEAWNSVLPNLTSKP